MVNMITAQEARLITATVNYKTENRQTYDTVEHLIKLTAAAGASRVVLTLYKDMVEAFKIDFSTFTITEIDYKETLYPDCIVVIMAW